MLVTCTNRCEHLLLQDVPSIIKNCKAPGPLYLSVLSEDELRHLNNMMGRLYQIAEAATAVSASSSALTEAASSHRKQAPASQDVTCPC